MERYPLDNVTDENFWKTESDLKLYLNKLYPAYIKGHGDGWSQDKYITPLPVTGSPLAYGDFIQITVYVQVVNQKNWQD